MNGQGNELPERLVFIPWAVGCMEGGGRPLSPGAAAWSWAPAERAAEQWPGSQSGDTWRRVLVASLELRAKL